MGHCWHARLLRAVGVGIAALSPAVLRRLARVLVRLPLLNARRSRIAAINIGLCFPQLDASARRALLARTLDSNALGALETLCGWFSTPARLAGRVHVVGLEHLQTALAAGRGVVVMGAHYDGIELAMRNVADALAQPMPILVRSNNDPCIEAVIAAARERYAGATFDKKNVAGWAAQVQAGRAVFYVPDQDAARRTVFVPFMGVQAATLGAIGGVLKRCGGAVLLMWARRDAEGVQHIDLTPAWPDWAALDEAALAARYMSWIEARLQDAPEQYLWVHRRFKTRPPGEPKLY